MYPNPDFDQPSDRVDWPALAKLDAVVRRSPSTVGPPAERLGLPSRALIAPTWDSLTETLYRETGPFSVFASVALARNESEDST